MGFLIITILVVEYTPQNPILVIEAPILESSQDGEPYPNPRISTRTSWTLNSKSVLEAQLVQPFRV